MEIDIKVLLKVLPRLIRENDELDYHFLIHRVISNAISWERHKYLFSNFYYLFISESNPCVMMMDFQVVPETKLTEKQRKESEEAIRKFVQEHNEKVQAQIKQLKAAGYSDQEIEESFAF